MSDLLNDAWVRALPVAALLVDWQGTILNANPAARKWVGGDDAIGRRVFDQLPGLEALEEEFVDNLAQSTLPPAVLIEAGEEGAKLKVQLRPIHGAERSVCLALLEPLAEGSEATEQRLADAEGRLLSVRRVRHEMNNLLMGVLGHCELLLNDKQLDPHVRGKVEKVMAQSQRLREAIQQLSRVVKGS